MTMTFEGHTKVKVNLLWNVAVQSHYVHSPFYFHFEVEELKECVKVVLGSVKYTWPQWSAHWSVLKGKKTRHCGTYSVGLHHNLTCKTFNNYNV